MRHEGPQRKLDDETEEILGEQPRGDPERHVDERSDRDPVGRAERRDQPSAPRSRHADREERSSDEPGPQSDETADRQRVPDNLLAVGGLFIDDDGHFGDDEPRDVAEEALD